MQDINRCPLAILSTAHTPMHTCCYMLLKLINKHIKNEYATTFVKEHHYIGHAWQPSLSLPTQIVNKDTPPHQITNVYAKISDWNRMQKASTCIRFASVLIRVATPLTSTCSICAMLVLQASFCGTRVI